MGRRTLRCPICRKPVELSDPLSPFCSERCRLIDLGNWASERYAIRSPLPDVDIAGSDLPEAEVAGTGPQRGRLATKKQGEAEGEAEG